MHVAVGKLFLIEEKCSDIWAPSKLIGCFRQDFGITSIKCHIFSSCGDGVHSNVSYCSVRTALRHGHNIYAI